MVKLEFEGVDKYHVLNETLQDYFWLHNDSWSYRMLVRKYLRSYLRMKMNEWHALYKSIRTIIQQRIWPVEYVRDIHNVEWKHDSQMNKPLKTYAWEDTSQAYCQFAESSIDRWLSVTIEYFWWFSYPIYSILRSISAILFDTILNFRSECRLKDTMWRNSWTWLKPVVVAFISIGSSSYSDMLMIWR
jgi:hypothetical protein